MTLLAPDRRPLLHACGPRPPTSGSASLTVGKDLARDYATVRARGASRLDARRRASSTHAAQPRGASRLPPQRQRAAATSRRPSCAASTRSAACVVVAAAPRRRIAYGSEGGGLTALLEGMAMGRPVVATERAILRDYVDDGVEALRRAARGSRRRCAPRSSACSAIRSCARSLGAAGRARVERAHTTRGFAAQLAPRPPRRRLRSADMSTYVDVVPLPRAVRQPLPPRPAGEVPRLGARRRSGRSRTRCC